MIRIASITVIGICLMVEPVLAVPLPLNERLTYQHSLTNLSDSTMGADGLFCVGVDETGIGHLSPRCALHPSKSFSANRFPNDWKERLTYWDQKRKDWSLLNFDRASELWGKPKKRKPDNGKPIFYTFSVHSSSDFTRRELNEDEENIFHLDFEFREDGSIKAYRIRGIGITTPSWIDKSWMPAGKSAKRPEN